MSSKDFMTAMAKHVPEGAAIMCCQFRGDPNDSFKGKWVSRPVYNMRQFDPEANIYLAVSAMKKNSRGEYRRRKENFAGGLLLMVDDVGSGPGAKAPLSILDKLTPTALIETSPDNYQAVYMFNSLVTDEDLFDSLIRAFIEAKFLGTDSGMSGVNRVFRPPIGINGKAKYGGNWKVQLRQWHPNNRYSIQEIATAFNLDLKPPRSTMRRGACADHSENIKAFIATRSALRSAGMLKSERANASGWIDIHCPWTEMHSGQTDNGASIREPAEENGWNGAFRCHHGHCIEKGWSDLTQWLAEEQENVLNMINKKWSEQ